MRCRVCGKDVGLLEREAFRRMCQDCAAGISPAARSRSMSRRCAALWAATGGDLGCRPFTGDVPILAVTSLAVSLVAGLAPRLLELAVEAVSGEHPGTPAGKPQWVAAWGLATYLAGLPLHSTRDGLLWQRWRTYWGAFSAAFWGAGALAAASPRLAPSPWGDRAVGWFPPFWLLASGCAATCAAYLVARLCDTVSLRRAAEELRAWRTPAGAASAGPQRDE